jgi:hypothetical protein
MAGGRGNIRAVSLDRVGALLGLVAFTLFWCIETTQSAQEAIALATITGYHGPSDPLTAIRLAMLGSAVGRLLNYLKAFALACGAVGATMPLIQRREWIELWWKSLR